MSESTNLRLAALNRLPTEELTAALFRCCGSRNWVEKVAAQRSFKDERALFEAAEQIWQKLDRADWLEAFTHHPKIGDTDSLRRKFATTKQWAEGEQSGVRTASEDVLCALLEGNRSYEARFGYIFIVCATGKSAAEMLTILEARLPNDPEAELKIAAGEQSKITHIRLQKLLETFSS